jgi:hypothetical protein
MRHTEYYICIISILWGPMGVQLGKASKLQGWSKLIGFDG